MQRTAAAFLLFVGVAIAHTQMASITIGGVDRKDCLRGNFDPEAYKGSGIYEQYPIMQTGGQPDLPNGILSQNYTCGFMPWGNQAASATCNVNAGDTLYLNYYHGGSYTGETKELDNWIAHSHYGPIMISMAQITGTSHVGAKWFKIWQKGMMTYNIDGSKSEWASAVYLNQKGGKVDFQIPSDLAPGKYLLRTELLALHSASQVSGAQPYVRCAELNVIGSGKITATQIANAGYTMVIPSDAYATLKSPGILYNVWWDPVNPYPYPGGDKVYKAGAIATTPPPAPSPPGTPSTPAPTPAPTSAPTPAPTPAPTSAPTPAPTPSPGAPPPSGTAPDFSTFSNCVQVYDQGINYVKYYWTVAGDSINMAIAGTFPAGYVAVGLSVDGTMGSLGRGSDAWFVARNNNATDKCYYGNANGGCVGDIWIPAYTIKIDDQQDVTNVKVGSDGTILWGTFTRKLNTGDSTQDKAITLTDPWHLIFGAHNNPTQFNNVPFHTAYGGAKGTYTFGGSYTCDETPIVPVSPPAQASVVQLIWAFSNKLKTGSCIQITEPKDPHTWDDNWLCAVNEDISKWRWSSEGRTVDDSYNAVQWLEGSDKDGWNNNYLLIPVSDTRKYAWSSAGIIPGMTCTRIFEGADPNTWTDNYFCTSLNGNGVINVGYNGVYNNTAPHDIPSDFIAIDTPSGSDASTFVASVAVVFVAALLL